MSKLPDFFIIGAMKSATSTLQEQLAQQSGIFMSDPKEPNFFSDDAQYSRGLKWYNELFASAPQGSLLGEASTHYTKLPNYPQTVKRLNEHFSEARLIYIMRHPVDRLVSHYIHEWSMGVYHCDIEKAIEEYPEMVNYGQYAYQLEPYFEAFGRDAVLPVFFDRLTHNSQEELERVCKFIGYEGIPRWSNEQQPSNVSSQRIRRFPLYGMLIESDIATWLRRKLVPGRLRDAVKTQLTMRHRPVLNDEVRRDLEALFDQDLARVGHWLGVDLNCSNFKQVTIEKTLNWVSTDGE